MPVELAGRSEDLDRRTVGHVLPSLKNASVAGYSVVRDPNVRRAHVGHGDAVGVTGAVRSDAGGRPSRRRLPS
jgi:hypothetical protein